MTRSGRHHDPGTTRCAHRGTRCSAYDASAHRIPAAVLKKISNFTLSIAGALHAAGATIVRVVRNLTDLAGVRSGKDPILAQRYHAPDGRDRKIYSIGGRLFGVKKTFSALTEEEQHGEPFTPTPELCEIAVRCGRAFGIDLYGVDIVESAGQPYVVDVSGIPGFRGVPDIERGHLMSVTACLAPARTVAYPNGGGHFWVYLQWALGLRALGCRIIWLEQVAPAEPVEQTHRSVAVLQTIDANSSRASSHDARLSAP